MDHGSWTLHGPPPSQQSHPSSEAPPQSERERGLSGTITNIVLCFLALTIPLTVFAAILLYFVYNHRIVQTPSGGELGAYTESSSTGVLYVDFSATYLLWLSSWSSTVAPSLSGLAVALAAYSVARTIAKESSGQASDSLLTPYQFFLTLCMINSAGYMALWHWISYQVGWRKKRQKQPTYMIGLGFVLTTAIYLGLLVVAGDTWLHVSTNSVNYDIIEHANSLPLYSDQLNSSCLGSNNSFNAQQFQTCSIGISATHEWLPNAQSVLPILYNTSNVRSINIYSYAPTFAYFGIPSDGRDQRVDFTASTYSVATQCKPVSTECNLDQTSGATIVFDCPMYPAFSGDVLQDPLFAMTFFTDGTGSNNQTYNSAVANPYYFGIAGIANYDAYGLTSLQDDPEILVPERGGVAYVLFCNSTVYDTTYTVVNGSVVDFAVSQSNDSLANIVEAVVEGAGSSAQNIVRDRANLASLQAATAQDFATQLATVYSQVSLALGTGALVQVPVAAAQVRRQAVVTEIGITPLFFLVVANLLLAAFGIILTFIALFARRDEGAREVQARLSLQYLVAEHFEGERSKLCVRNLDEMFEEKAGKSSNKVGAVRSPAHGWMFAIRR